MTRRTNRNSRNTDSLAQRVVIAYVKRNFNSTAQRICTKAFVNDFINSGGTLEKLDMLFAEYRK